MQSAVIWKNDKILHKKSDAICSASFSNESLTGDSYTLHNALWQEYSATAPLRIPLDVPLSSKGYSSYNRNKKLFYSLSPKVLERCRPALHTSLPAITVCETFEA